MFIHDMKTQPREPKKQGGLSLRPELWNRIDDAARIAGVKRNQVIETVLMREFGLLPNFRKSQEDSRKPEATPFEESFV